MMDNAEAMYWLAVVRKANEGSKEAEEIIRQENELRTETGQPTVEEELKNLTNKEARLEATINELKQIVKASKRDIR